MKIHWPVLVALAVGAGPGAMGRPRRPRPTWPCFGAVFALNGNGEMTGTAWVRESGGEWTFWSSPSERRSAALVAASTMTGFRGRTVPALPHDRLREVRQRHGRLVSPAR